MGQQDGTKNNIEPTGKPSNANWLRRKISGRNKQSFTGSPHEDVVRKRHKIGCSGAKRHRGQKQTARGYGGGCSDIVHNRVSTPRPQLYSHVQNTMSMARLRNTNEQDNLNNSMAHRKMWQRTKPKRIYPTFVAGSTAPGSPPTPSPLGKSSAAHIETPPVACLRTRACRNSRKKSKARKGRRRVKSE